MPTVVIGLGNSLLSDDGLGPHVVSQLRREVPETEDRVYKTVSVGGIELMTELIGFDRAIIVDAMVTGCAQPGTVTRIELSSLISTCNLNSTHDANLGTALEMGGLLGLSLPSDVEVWGVEANDVETFSETLSPEVDSALPELVSEIRNFLSRPQDSGVRVQAKRKI